MIWFFSVIRVQSLKGIGVPDEELLSIGVQLINAQIIGMLIGGILGDKMGPLKVLFGSILMYSWANIVNRFVADVTTYAKFLKQGKKIVIAFLFATLVSMLLFLFSKGISANTYHWICVLLGLSTGFWVIFVTIAAEQFGTNLRSTVTTTVPNFIRGSVVLVTLSFEYLKTPLGIVNAGLVIGLVTLIIAFIAAFNLEETFGKDLNYIEE